MGKLVGPNREVVYDGLFVNNYPAGQIKGAEKDKNLLGA